MAQAAPTRVWVRFGASIGGRAEAWTRLDHYRVDSVVCVSGAPLTSVDPGAPFIRIESRAPFPPGSGELVGVTQHLAYTREAERRELAATSAKESGPTAVLIPIKKSDSWWSLAQDERERLLRPQTNQHGHLAIGFRYAGVVFRKLYHARYFGESAWDFLTYFEFPAQHEPDFRALLATLRDPTTNPEWAYVERESEVWMTRLRADEPPRERSG